MSLFRESLDVLALGLFASFAWGCGAGGEATPTLEGGVDSSGVRGDACPGDPCTGICTAVGAIEVSTVVDGCEVWQCCVVVDAGAEAAPGDATVSAVDASADAGAVDASADAPGTLADVTSGGRGRRCPERRGAVDRGGLRRRGRVRARVTQNARSVGWSRGRGVARRRIASCWRSTRFSANRIARGRSAANSAPTRASKIAFKTGDHRPVHRRRHRRIGTLVRVRSPRAHLVDSPHNRVENEVLDSTALTQGRPPHTQPLDSRGISMLSQLRTRNSRMSWFTAALRIATLSVERGLHECEPAWSQGKNFIMNHRSSVSFHSKGGL